MSLSEAAVQAALKQLVDPNTGKLLVQQPKSATLLTDPLQTPTMVLLNGKIMQASITGIARIG